MTDKGRKGTEDYGGQQTGRGQVDADGDPVQDVLESRVRLRLAGPDRQEVWAAVEAAMDAAPALHPRPRGARLDTHGTGLRRSAMTGVAAVAAVVAAAGVYAGIQRTATTHRPPTQVPAVLAPVPASEVGPAHNPSPPYEVVGKDWYVVVTKSQMDSGPSYDWQLYYTGQHEATDISYTSGYTGLTTGGSTTALPGAMAVFGPDAKFAGGIGNVRQTLTWLENGRQSTQTLDFATAPIRPLSVLRSTVMVGHNAGFVVDFVGEQVGALSVVSAPLEELRVSYHGTPLPKQASLHVVLTSPTGSVSATTQTNFINGSVMTAQYAENEAGLLSSDHATLTITWPGHKVVMPMATPTLTPGLRPATSMAARTNDYYRAQVGKVYGDVSATVARVTPHVANVNGQVGYYTVTIRGSFRERAKFASQITYDISADGEHLWRIRATGTAGTTVWTDSALPKGGQPGSRR